MHVRSFISHKTMVFKKQSFDTSISSFIISTGIHTIFFKIKFQPFSLNIQTIALSSQLNYSSSKFLRRLVVIYLLNWHLLVHPIIKCNSFRRFRIIYIIWRCPRHTLIREYLSLCHQTTTVIHDSAFYSWINIQR